MINTATGSPAAVGRVGDDQAALVGDHDELRAVAGLEFGQRPAQVCLDRCGGVEEGGGGPTAGKPALIRGVCYF
jgi:hypothetical protein